MYRVKICSVSRAPHGQWKTRRKKAPEKWLREGGVFTTGLSFDKMVGIYLTLNPTSYNPNPHPLRNFSENEDITRR